MPTHSEGRRTWQGLPTGTRRTRRAVDREGVDRRAPSAPLLVAIHDPPAEQLRLDHVLAGSHLTPRWVRDGATVTSLRRADDCGVALVPVQEEAKPALLEAVAVLKRKGYTVLCCWEGAGTWPLGAKCRLLVAGAAHLLDATSPEFVTELRERLVHLFAAEAERQSEDHRTRQQMLAMGIVGTGPAITAVFRRVLRVSVLSDLPVLIVGETGTGKELAARAIHSLDPRRRDAPFVAVNCGAISTGLAESELFGHRRGAFTGAAHDRKGLVRAAHGGVLFLDEIGDLDAGLQGKLLRVLQERRVLAVGEDQEVPVDVRIIAATNRDMESMVRGQAFRADLFHRLNVLTVFVPALRDRPDDIEPLIRHLIASCGGQAPGREISASHEFIHALRRVELRGNVRELENVVRRAMLTCNGNSLRLSDLPPELWSELANGAAGAPDDDTAKEAVPSISDVKPDLIDPVAVLQAASWKLGPAVDLCEQKIVAAALGISNGNRSRAARMLGISPRSFFNKMRKYRLAG